MKLIYIIKNMGNFSENGRFNGWKSYNRPQSVTPATTEEKCCCKSLKKYVTLKNAGIAGLAILILLALKYFVKNNNKSKKKKSEEDDED